jgi:hypothetical protein
MYLGSAAAMLALPSLAARLGPVALLRFVGCLGLAWLALWQLTLRRVRRLAATAAMPLLDVDLESKGHGREGKGHGKKARSAPTPWRSMLTHPAGALLSASVCVCLHACAAEHVLCLFVCVCAARGGHMRCSVVGPMRSG